MKNTNLTHNAKQGLVRAFQMESRENREDNYKLLLNVENRKIVCSSSLNSCFLLSRMGIYQSNKVN